MNAVRTQLSITGQLVQHLLLLPARPFARGLAAGLALGFALVSGEALAWDQLPKIAPSDKPKHEACTKLGDRTFDLCMAGPKADSGECVDASDEAYARCFGGTQPAPPAGAPPKDLQLSANLYRIPYVDGTKIHITHDFCDYRNSFGKMDIVGRGGGPYLSG